MKKITPILLLTSLLLSACSIGNKEDVFQKKQECIKFEEQMLKQALDITNVHGVSGINEIFYSPQKETCFYTAKGTQGLILFDYLSKKFVDSYSYTNLEDRDRFEKKVKELKGE